MNKFVGWAWKDIKSRNNVDVWLLAALAMLFAVLGVFGVDEKLLGSCMLGLLGILAISQIKSRDQVSEVSAKWRRGRTEIFSTGFPEEYFEARSTASSHYFFAGTTMKRTLATMEYDITRILKNNGSIRILLPDPNNNDLLQMIATTRGESSIDHIRQSIQSTLNSAKHLHSKVEGNLKIRTTQVLPRVGINALELGLPSASIMVQMYGFTPADESKPIFVLTPADKDWFEHFEEEVERLWGAGADYP